MQPRFSTPARAAIHKRLAELTRIDSVSVPIEAGECLFFSRRRAEEQLAVICMRRGRDGDDEVLIDPRALSPDLKTSVNVLAVSNDGAMLAYGVRRGGEDELKFAC
jgi:prolyl oligopeptidase